jgi:hypothetical protein
LIDGRAYRVTSAITATASEAARHMLKIVPELATSVLAGNGSLDGGSRNLVRTTADLSLRHVCLKSLMI